MMRKVAFLQSDCSDPFPLYRMMQAECPVYEDREAGLWAVYRYDDCARLLQSGAAHIPQPDLTGLSDAAQGIAHSLVRLANGEDHRRFRAVAEGLFRNCRRTDPAICLRGLIGEAREINWVEVVAKKLPMQGLLDGFGFAAADRDCLMTAVPVLTRIMLPRRAVEDISAINAVADEALARVERRLGDMGLDGPAAAANLIGLLIQSYDAGRGLLTNALWAVFEHGWPQDLKSFVIETLRFYPPIHNTRRVLAAPMMVGDSPLSVGSVVLLVLAAANRDPMRFSDPDRFDPLRPDNGDHLTFGLGGHRCVADHMMVGLTAAVLQAVRAHWPDCGIAEEPRAVEPLGNARLPTALSLRLW